MNAVYGFTNILLNVIRDMEPAYLIVTFDQAEPTFRHTEYVGYKAQRPEMPTELASQLARVTEVVEVLNVPIFGVKGYEADDVIGTLALQATRLDQVVIVTGDKDELQLVRDDRVVVQMPPRGKVPGKLYDQELVEAEYGLQPMQIPDLKGLAGDASDNIVGVKGIGFKTATRLLQQFGTVEGIYKHLGEVGREFSERIMNLLVEGHESALLSKRMATIVCDVPIELDLRKCQVTDYDKEQVVELFNELEFKSLIKKLPNDSFEEMVQSTLF